jgi:hypothetical protein
VALNSYEDDLPQYVVQRKVNSNLTVPTFNAPTGLPKGPKLLQVSPHCGQHLEQPEIDRIVEKSADTALLKPGACETQIWGVPWTEEQFTQQMVAFGHPATLQSGIPAVLREAIQRYREMDVHQRISYRASRLSFWLKQMVALKEQENQLKASMDSDVVKEENILLWDAMLRAVGYADLGVVEEFKRGTELVGEVEKTGLWPVKFQPAVIGVDELYGIAAMREVQLRDSLSVAATLNSQNKYGPKLWTRFQLGPSQALSL